MAYMRMAKVLLALHLCREAGINLENKSIFDYGFGAGTFFRYCPLSSQLYGVEMDPQNVAAVEAMLKARGNRRADLRPIDIEHWSEHPLLKQTYDIVLCSHVLEHLPDPVFFLKRIRECIKPSGVFLGLVPINERKLDPHHVQRVDRSKINEWANASGLRMTTYIEGNPWLYWVQPLFASQNRATHLLAQAISLFLGVAATAAGQRVWVRAGNVFGRLTRSLPVQAAFVLTHANGRPNEVVHAR
jgi:SAM-dependent methyltransferase